jgi:hypothetical protein
MTSMTSREPVFCRGDSLRLETDPDRPPGLPVPSLVVQPVRVVRGDRARWLVVEVGE